MNKSLRSAKAYRFGFFAESLCCLLLRLKGYRILARRLRTPFGEIDIAARRGDVVAIVEVKASIRHASAAEALQPRQRQRIERAAHHFLARRPDLAARPGFCLRYDLMLTTPYRLPQHIKKRLDHRGIGRK